MTEDLEEIFAVVAEWGNQGPIVMETEGDATTRDAAYRRMDELLKGPGVLRACVVRLEFAAGNSLLMHDLKRMQAHPYPRKPPL